MTDWGAPTDKTLVEYRVEGGIAIMELSDPPANTYTYNMMQQLERAILTARMDDSAHVILLRGKGDKFFSAGANISMLNEVTPRFKYFFCLSALPARTAARLDCPRSTWACCRAPAEPSGWHGSWASPERSK